MKKYSELEYEKNALLIQYYISWGFIEVSDNRKFAKKLTAIIQSNNLRKFDLLYYYISAAMINGLHNISLY